MKVSRYAGFLLVLFLILMPSLVALAQPPVAARDDKLKLALKLRAGQKLSMSYAMEQLTTQSVPGVIIDSRQTMRFGLETRVLAAHDDGSFTVSTTYKSIKIDMETAGFNFSYDSEAAPAAREVDNNPATAMMTAIFSAMKNQSMKMRLMPDGTAADVTGLEEMWVSIKKAIVLPEGEGREQVEKMLDGMKPQFGDQQARGMAAASVTFPGKVIGIGDTWQSPVKAATSMLAATSQYTLKSRKDGVAAIEVGTQMRFQPQAGAAAPMQGLEGAGVQIGTLEVDEATGWLRSGKLTLLMTGTIALNAPNAGAPMMLPLYSRVNIEITPMAAVD